MIIAFLLVVVVNSETVSDNRMLFSSIYRCNEFATAIEEGRVSPNNLKRYRTQKNLTAYCIPKMVNKNTELFE
jgi:hypothetical protein